PDRSTLTRREFRSRLRDRLQEMRAPQLVDRLDDSLLDLGPVDRRLAMLSAGVFEQPALLCVDEPTAGLEDEDAEGLIDFLRLQAERRSVLLVTHHQRRARSIANRVALLAGGTICERAPVDEFFDAPKTEQARSFVRTGSCTVASPDARPEELAPGYRDGADSGDDGSEVVLLKSSDEGAEPVPAAPSARRGPTGFHWMRPGELAGTPMPGAMRPIEEDLEALRRVGVTVLVTLTLQPLHEEAVGSYGIINLHVPIVDMGVPSVREAAELCRTVDEYLDDGEVVAFHCRAGIGRTGTMLAIQEIWDGMTAEQAFEAARSVHRRWIQSRRQREFLSEFEQWLE
ncbi:MAG: fused DSP-PTPase phosphatase/NAD kinase-like protein, partial [Persicimonas sp.]